METQRSFPGAAPARPLSALVAGPLLALAVVLAYLPALRAGFVWDDDAYVLQNTALRSLTGLKRIWFELGAVPQYYPLVHSSFWVEWQLFGAHPLGYHLTNVLLHGLNATLVLVLLRRLGLPGALLAALLFAVHPVHVESVAWVTERKNVLSASLYLGAALAWLRFRPLDSDEETGHGANGSRVWYGLAFALFLGALFSKTVTATLPAALLLAAWWRRGRLARTDVLPLLPFFALGALMGLLTAWIEVHDLGGTGAGASGPEWDLSPAQRVLIAGRALIFYAGKLLWPHPLVFIYERWEVDPAAFFQWLFPAVALALLASAWLARRRSRAPLALLLFFAGTLFPALGFLNVYPFRYSFVADHFQYLASLGPLALLAAGATLLARRHVPAPARTALVLAVGLALGALTWQRTHAFRDLEALWTDTLKKNPGCWMARVNLGVLRVDEGRLAEAEASFRAALENKPDEWGALVNLGNVLARQGRSEEAEEAYRRAIRGDETTSPSPHTGLGLLLASGGDLDGAIGHWERAVELAPDDGAALANLSVALTATRRGEEAVARVRSALEAAPREAELYVLLAERLADLDREDEALGVLERLLDWRPDHEEAARLEAVLRWRR